MATADPAEATDPDQAAAVAHHGVEDQAAEAADPDQVGAEATQVGVAEAIMAGIGVGGPEDTGRAGSTTTHHRGGGG